MQNTVPETIESEAILGHNAPRSAESKPHVFEWSLPPIRTKAG